MEREKPKLKLTTIHLPEAYIRDLEELVRQKKYSCRSEAIRMAVRDLLKEELWRKQDDVQDQKV